MPMVLSRSSELYKFVFGEKSRWFVRGFAEPRSDRISSGLFLGLLLAMTFIRIFAAFMLVIFDGFIRFVSFFADGSYVCGSFPENHEVKTIEPWPRIHGWRFSPWLILVAGTVGYQYYAAGAFEAAQWLFALALATGLFLNTDANSKSPAMVLSDTMEPHINEALRNGYYSEPRVFPVLVLVE